jgi:predicted nucleic acid-binding protein
MIVVADTSPLNYLVLIGVVNVLEPLYGRVVIPNRVATELRA